jgi:hypothetical protein
MLKQLPPVAIKRSRLEQISQQAQNMRNVLKVQASLNSMQSEYGRELRETVREQEGADKGGPLWLVLDEQAQRLREMIRGIENKKAQTESMDAFSPISSPGYSPAPSQDSSSQGASSFAGGESDEDEEEDEEEEEDDEEGSDDGQE